MTNYDDFPHSGTFLLKQNPVQAHRLAAGKEGRRNLKWWLETRLDKFKEPPYYVEDGEFTIIMEDGVEVTVRVGDWVILSKPIGYLKEVENYLISHATDAHFRATFEPKVNAPDYTAIIQEVRNGGHAVEIAGVKIQKCDTYGNTQMHHGIDFGGDDRTLVSYAQRDTTPMSTLIDTQYLNYRAPSMKDLANLLNKDFDKIKVPLRKSLPASVVRRRLAKDLLKTLQEGVDAVTDESEQSFFDQVREVLDLLDEANRKVDDSCDDQGKETGGASQGETQGETGGETRTDVLTSEEIMQNSKELWQAIYDLEERHKTLNTYVAQNADLTKRDITGLRQSHQSLKQKAGALKETVRMHSSDLEGMKNSQEMLNRQIIVERHHRLEDAKAEREKRARETEELRWEADRTAKNLDLPKPPVGFHWEFQWRDASDPASTKTRWECTLRLTSNHWYGSEMVRDIDVRVKNAVGGSNFKTQSVKAGRSLQAAVDEVLERFNRSDWTRTYHL